MDQTNILGPYLRLARMIAGYSYTHLSQLLREQGKVISPRRLKKIEEQTSTVYMSDLLALAEVFRVPADDFVGRRRM